MQCASLHYSACATAILICKRWEYHGLQKIVFDHLIFTVQGEDGFALQGLVCRGGRYIDKKLSKADKSTFLKLSANHRYQKMGILKLSKIYRYWKMHQI